MLNPAAAIFSDGVVVILRFLGLFAFLLKSMVAQSDADPARGTEQTKLDRWR